MNLFESIMEAALSNGSDRKKFLDVTTKCVSRSIVSRYEAIIIESCLDVKFTNKADKPQFKIFLKNQDDVQKIHVEIAENKDRIKEVGICYVDTPEPMHELAAKIKEINPEINVLVAETSPIIATHAGNGAYAILYYLE